MLCWRCPACKHWRSIRMTNNFYDYTIEHDSTKEIKIVHVNVKQLYLNNWFSHQCAYKHHPFQTNTFLCNIDKKTHNIFFYTSLKHAFLCNKIAFIDVCKCLSLPELSQRQHGWLHTITKQVKQRWNNAFHLFETFRYSSILVPSSFSELLERLDIATFILDFVSLWLPNESD